VTNLTAIIVDDEESARNVLHSLLLRNCPQVEVVAICKNIPEAADAIQEHHPQLVFLDVQMPNYAGYEIVNFVDEIDFEIIFTTAFDQYALKAFELSATDYLLKPINRTRLVEAVDKVSLKVEGDRKLEHLEILISSMKEEKVERIVVSELGNKRVVELELLLAVEAQGAYSLLHLKDGRTITVSKNLKHFEELLQDSSTFFRTHKSWIINLNELVSIKTTKGCLELTGSLEAKLSKYRVEAFNSALNESIH
jgi:two-component system LytT family response regulator